MCIPQQIVIDGKFLLEYKIYMADERDDGSAIIAFRAPGDMLAWIDKQCEDEQRTRANMVLRLLAPVFAKAKKSK